MLRAIIRDEALADIEGICAYIGQSSPRSALRFARAVIRAVDGLPSMPGIGTLRDFGNDALAGMRVIPVPGFRAYGVYYVTTPFSVEVLRVIHGSRDLDSIFSAASE